MSKLRLDYTSQNYILMNASTDAESSKKASKRSSSSPSSSQSKRARLKNVDDVVEKFNQIIKDHRSLYLKILSGKPIFFSELRSILRENRLQCSENILKEYLDEQGICYTKADENVHQNWRSGRRKATKKR